jgi:hypothetical protein
MVKNQLVFTQNDIEKEKEAKIMSKKQIVALSVVLMFAMSITVFAASPWISVIDPNPQTIWQKNTESMVNNTDPLTVWKSGQEYMIVWDSAGLAGNVKVDLLKSGAVVATLSPAGGVAIGENGKGFLKTIVAAPAGSGEYQIQVSSLATPGISSISEPVSIIIK